MLRALLIVALAALILTDAKRVNIKDKISLSVGETEEAMPGSLDGASPYRYVQQVGLSLYTFPEGFGKQGMQAFYNGIDGMMTNDTNASGAAKIDIMDDVMQRVKIMQDMMEVAHQSQFYSREENVLKIFMAPEFFFRGPHGAYDMRNLGGCPVPDECDKPITTILESLSDAVKDAKWKDWVFVFGTIVAFAGDSKYFNFAPVLRGGPGDPVHHIVSKTFVSGIDFLDCPSAISQATGGFCVRNPQKLGAGQYAMFSKKEVLGLARAGYRIQRRNKFRFAGITFGLEVCLDHAQKELAEHSEGVQVHLIVSAGMAIQWTVPKLPGATHNGPVFLQDGGAAGAHTQYYCPGCPYLDSGMWGRPARYSPNTIVQSPTPQTSFDMVKRNASRRDIQGLMFGTPPSTERWFSPTGFGTEGTGLGVDPRFAAVRINHIFADDDYMPKINIGPAFEVPVPVQPAAPHPKRASVPGSNPNTARANQDHSCSCLNRWNTASHGSCTTGCCLPTQDLPFGWCMTYGTCNGGRWKVCRSRSEPRVNN